MSIGYVKQFSETFKVSADSLDSFGNGLIYFTCSYNMALHKSMVPNALDMIRQMSEWINKEFYKGKNDVSKIAVDLEDYFWSCAAGTTAFSLKKNFYLPKLQQITDNILTDNETTEDKLYYSAIVWTAYTTIFIDHYGKLDEIGKGFPDMETGLLPVENINYKLESVLVKLKMLMAYHTLNVFECFRSCGKL